MAGSPHLKGLDVDAIAARVEAAGDPEAAAALRHLRDAVVCQDEALRDLVADARHLAENHEDDGTYTDIHSRADGFDELATAFGYPPIQATDPAAAERERDPVHGPGPYDGLVCLSGLEHLQARMMMDTHDPDELAGLGYVPVETGTGAARETLYHWPPGQDVVLGLKP